MNICIKQLTLSKAPVNYFVPVSKKCVEKVFLREHIPGSCKNALRGFHGRYGCSQKMSCIMGVFPLRYGEQKKAEVVVLLFSLSSYVLTT